MKLADIRCETCPLFKERGAVEEHKGWCTAGLGVVYRDVMCATHPLWQQALDSYELVQIKKGDDDAAKD